MENKNLIDKAIGFIQKNPQNNLSLQSIADNAGFSLTYFDAIFRQHTGYSPVEYSRIYKLTRSALELHRTPKTVLEIALDFGYASPESFTRAFKSFTVLRRANTVRNIPKRRLPGMTFPVKLQSVISDEAFLN